MCTIICSSLPIHRNVEMKTENTEVREKGVEGREREWGWGEEGGG